MKKMLHYVSCTAISMMCYAGLQAETTEVVLSNSMKCTKEELMRFFPEQLVQSVLVKANLPKDQADAIAQDLSQKDRELARLVEEKSAQVEPNPFKNLSQRDMAIKIYRETLYEVFARVLKAHGITNEDQIQTLLDELQEARSKLFIECIRKQPKSSGPSS
jgi:glycine cleavage system regulatory protein